MELLNFFAMVGMLIDNLLALYSVLGSAILLFTSFSNNSSRRNSQFTDWSILGLAFGGLGQIAMAITHTTPEQIGFILQMSPASVNEDPKGFFRYRTSCQAGESCIL